MTVHVILSYLPLPPFASPLYYNMPVLSSHVYDHSLAPRPPHAAFVACSMKIGGRPGGIYHVMRAAAYVMFSLLTSGFVLSPSLFFPWIQFVLSVQFVLQVRLLLDRSWLATIRDVSSSTHHVINPSRPSPRFSYCKRQSWAWRPGNEAKHGLLYV